jgi:hypothetical protein
MTSTHFYFWRTDTQFTSPPHCLDLLKQNQTNHGKIRIKKAVRTHADPRLWNVSRNTRQEIGRRNWQTVQETPSNDVIMATEELSIELDCAPMTPRPDTYIDGVLEGTGLAPDDFEITSKLFGNWKWELKDCSNLDEKQELFKKAKPQFKERITNLHSRGKIRYGSW